MHRSKLPTQDSRQVDRVSIQVDVDLSLRACNREAHILDATALMKPQYRFPSNGDNHHVFQTARSR